MRGVGMIMMLGAPAVAFAVPQTLSHQGRLVDVAGAGLNGSEDMVFQIYEQASGGAALFTESIDDVALTDGYYSVVLGAASVPIEADDLDGGPRYLGVTVGTNDEMLPRTPLASVPYAIHAQNVVAVDDPSACGAQNTGALQFDSTSGVLEVCDGTNWQEVSGGASANGPDNAYLSCSAAFADGNTASGVYWIDPDNGGSFQVWCDMLGQGGDGGGWTLVAKTNGVGEGHWQDNDTNITSLLSPSTDASGVLGNSRRSALGSFYRITCGTVTRYGYLNAPSATARSNWNGSSIFEWASAYSTDPAAYTTPVSADCGSTDCPGPGIPVNGFGRNWTRVNNPGCGIGQDINYGRTGTMWVK